MTSIQPNTQPGTPPGAHQGRGVAQAIYTRHQQLFYELVEHLKTIEERGDAASLATFLSDDLLSQVLGEEEHLYPQLRSGGTATDTMSVDHEFIENYVRRIRRAVAALQQARPDEQAAAREEVYRLGRQLEAILELHLAKEDHIYLPLLKQLSHERSEGEGTPTSERLREEAAAPQADAIEVRDMIDARGLTPTAGHARAFAAFGALRPGEAFILVIDRDPRPLRYELTWEYQRDHHGRLIWEPLEQGPQTWRITIGKSL